MLFGNYFVTLQHYKKQALIVIRNYYVETIKQEFRSEERDA